MTITNGYATLIDYKTWIAVRGLQGNTGADANDDAAIEVAIEAASRYLDRQTGRRFYADTNDATRYYQASDSACVVIDDLSAAPTSVSTDLYNLRTYEAMLSTYYDLVPDNALLEGKPYTSIHISPLAVVGFPTNRKGVRVIGKFGFPSVPTEIKEACLMIAQSVNSSRSGQVGGGGKITVTAAGVVIRPDDVPALAQATINNYRKRT